MKLQDVTPSAEAREGKWFTFEHPAMPAVPEGEERLELRIRTADLQAYRFALQNELQRLMAQANRKGSRRMDLPRAEAQAAAENHALARHVLVEVRGLDATLPEGAPFNGESVQHREWLLGASPYVREFVLDKSEDATAFLEERAGN